LWRLTAAYSSLYLLRFSFTRFLARVRAPLWHVVRKPDADPVARLRYGLPDEFRFARLAPRFVQRIDLRVGEWYADAWFI
jgi:hypothetical protein